jgi:signal recognition particle receptor subunit beta
MVQFNFSERTIKAKVVYYGPPQSGKTTNLEQIHRISDPEGANRLISLNTAQDRTLFFDLLPFSLGAVSGYDFKIQLYTVPGQVQYNATRRVVLAGADAVVFVADSQRSMLKENASAFENMKVNLLANRLVPEKVPLVLQYNKQDLPDALSRAELERALNPWGRKAVPAVAARGDGVMDTFVSVVQDMLAAIALKYNLKEKGLDPATVPDIVAQAFQSLLKKVGPAPPSGGSPARVVVTTPPDAEAAHAVSVPSAGGDAGPVSEELLTRAIRSNVELAETLSTFARDMHYGLGAILSHADLLLTYRDEQKRAAAVAEIQREAQKLRQMTQSLGQAAAAPGRAAGPAAPGRPAPPPSAPPPPASAARPPASRPPAPPPVPMAAPPPARPPAPAAPGPVPVADPSFDRLVTEALSASKPWLDQRRVAVNNRIANGTAAPRCPPVGVRRAVATFLQGLATVSPPGTSMVLRAERKPVLLRSREGEVKRDFLMLALAHAASLGADDQARVLQGADPGPLGEAHRLVREMGGFVRFAPLPGGALETRIFLPGA